MKRILCILFSVLMHIGLFSGCAEPDTGPLRICIDMSTHGILTDPQQVFYDVAGVLQSNEKIGEFVFEIIPGEGAEREAAIDRVRTEMMSGKGLDVLLVSCTREDNINSVPESLFPMPEKLLSVGMFLPLDQYIKNAEYGEWEEFPKVIMDAGRNEEGQLLVPLAYTLPAIVYRKADVDCTVTKETTWQEMLRDEELYRVIAPLADGLRGHYAVIGGGDALGIDSNINFILGDLADFETEKLNFTEEELLQRVLEVREINRYLKDTGVLNEGGWAYNTEGWYEGYLGIRFDECSFGLKNGVSSEDEITILPLCSDDGGVTASITAYAAVNRNTRKPEEAFTVIDRLLYLGMMEKSRVYQEYLYTYGDPPGSIPMNPKIFTEEYQRNGKWTNDYRLAPQKQEEFFRVLDSITHVEFSDSLHKTLEDMMMEALGAPDEAACAEIVREYYGILKQMTAE